MQVAVQEEKFSVEAQESLLSLSASSKTITNKTVTPAPTTISSTPLRISLNSTQGQQIKIPGTQAD